MIDPANGFPLENTDKDYKVVTSPSKLVQDKSQWIIYRPQREYLTNEIWDAIWDWVYERQNTLVYIDEILHVSDPVNLKPSKGIYYLLMTGRKRRIGIIACTQRPFRIPVSYLTESDHQFAFDLHLQDDRNRMAEIMGPEVRENPARIGGKYAFWYHNNLDNQTGLYRIKEVV